MDAVVEVWVDPAGGCESVAEPAGVWAVEAEPAGVEVPATAESVTAGFALEPGMMALSWHSSTQKHW